MILNFSEYRSKKLAKEKYRDELVSKIFAYFDSLEHKRDYDYYLDHVRSGFPIHVLEGILDRIESGNYEGIGS